MTSKNKILVLALLTAFSAQHTHAADTVIQSDKLKVGKANSAADKQIVLDINQGAGNPAIVSTPSQQDVQIKANTVRVGKPTAGDKVLDFNIGNGATNPKVRWNNSGAKIEFSNNGTDYKAIGSGSGGGSGISIVGDSNADFEAGTSSWTVSAGSFTIATTGSNLLFDTRSGVFNSSTSGQTLSNALVTIPGGLKGTNGAAACFFKTSAVDYKLQVFDGTNVLSETLIPPSTVAVKTSLSFIFPASGSVRLRIISQSDASDLAIDNCFLGSNELIATGQAELMGTATHPKTANCQWTVTANDTFTTFPPDSDCTTPTVTGKASAPATKIPGITFTTLPPGEYEVTASGVFGAFTPGVPQAWAITDGTTSSYAGTTYAGTQPPWTPTLTAHFSYTSVQSNVTFNFQSTGSTASGRGDIVDTSPSSDALVIRVKRFPNNTELASKFDGMAMSWSGSVTGTTSLSSVTEDDYPGTGVATQFSNRNMGTVVAASASNGVTWTPPKAGIWKVCASGNMDTTASAASPSIVLTDVANVHLSSIQNLTQAAAGGSSSFSRCASVPIVSAGSPYTVKLRSSINTGAVQLASPVDWSIENLDQHVAAPAIVGSVITGLAGIMNTVVFRFAGDPTETAECTTDPCTITYNSGGVSVVNNGGASNYYIHFNPGTFSAPPTCIYTGMDITQPTFITRQAGVGNTALIQSISAWSAAGTQQVDGVSGVCYGPK